MKISTAGLVLLSMLASAFAQDTSVQDSQAIQITRSGSLPTSTGPSSYFTGSVRIDPLFGATDPSRTSGARVTFEPGARTAWHSHTLGLTLIITAGTGRIQRWGDPIEEIRAGDVVWIPPAQKHWHGASPDSSMSHIGITEHLEGKRTEWMEEVSDSQYGVPETSESASGASPNGSRPSRAQTLMGDFAPKMAELTDEVLYGDIWERRQLSKRDRSLVTVAALVAMNRPDQLRSHLAIARSNGVTQEELVEVITHLAFYSGWPNAVTAISVAREVFQRDRD